MVVLCGALVMGAAACADHSPSTPEPRTLTGNWGSSHSAYASFALTETAGHLTGHGWLGPSVPFQAEGTRVGEDVVLTLSQVLFQEKLTFRGSFVNDALVGDVNGSERVSLTRVDTVADALAHVGYSSRFAGGALRAQFLVGADTLRITFGSGVQFTIQSKRDRVAPGTYAIGGATAPFSAEGLVSLVGSSGQAAFFTAASGQLVITHSSKRALMGSYQMDMVIGTEHITATGTFSAACSLDYAIPSYPKCPPDNP